MNKLNNKKNPQQINEGDNIYGIEKYYLFTTRNNALYDLRYCFLAF